MSTTWVMLMGLSWVGVAALCVGQSVELAYAGPAAVATAAHVAVLAEGGETEFRLDLTAGIGVEIYTLAHPYRVVIDLPDVRFQMDAGTGLTAGGVVQAFRFGAMGEQRSRVVIDTAVPVAVMRAAMVAVPAKQAGGGAADVQGVRLVLGLAAIDPQTFGEGTGVNRTTAARAGVKPAVYDGTTMEPRRPDRPVIMIDPGHGGIDPGAIGPQKVTEKAVVLAVALQLKAALEARGGIDVHLTRDGDFFIPLDQRVALSRAAKADVFISLHADTIEDGSIAKSVKGASIYSLSEKASDEQARQMADKENAADLAAGINPGSSDSDDEIRGILYDLMNRETASFSRLLSRGLVDALGKTGQLAREPERAAAFRVLKQAQVPSVLIELGFLSNPTEEQQMVQPHWQKQTASAMASAIVQYLADRQIAGHIPGARAAFGRLPP